MCDICQGKGLIPFKNKQGEVVPNAWQDCECKQPEQEHYHQVTPADFDFPISWDYYRSLCQYHGWPVPPPEPPFERDQQASTLGEHQPPALPRQADIDQLKGNLISLRDALKQHVLQTKPKRARGEY